MIETEKTSALIDAASRIVIAIINRADSPRIAQFGDLSHDSFRGGFISGDGTTAVSADTSHVRQLEMQTGFPELPVPLQGSLSQIAENLYLMDPSMIPLLLMQMTGQSDLVYLAHSMRLDKMDFDRIHSGRFIRSFAENITGFPWAGFQFLIFDHLGSVVCRNVLYRDAIFEVKCFKYTDRFREFPFLFKPEHPGVWFSSPLSAHDSILLDTDVKAILNGTSVANAWLNDAGDLMELDAEIFRKRHVTFVWHPQSEQGRSQFQSALRFFAVMKKHGIIAEIMDGDQALVLDQNAMIRQAYRYDLTVPDSLKVKSCFLSGESGNGFIPEDVPHFWTGGSSVLFFGPGQNLILEKLILSFSGKLDNGFPKKNMAIFFPTKAETRARKLRQKAGVQEIPFVGQSILHAEDDFEKLLCTESLEILFLIYADEFPCKDLIQILDVCEQSRVMTAVFTPGKENLVDVDTELISRVYFAVAQDDNIILKDMESNMINKYQFVENGPVEVQPSSEAEINREINGGAK